MDKTNHHLHKPVYIGEVKADGQFNVVWKTKGRFVPSRGVRSSRATNQQGPEGAIRRRFSSVAAS